MTEEQIENLKPYVLVASKGLLDMSGDEFKNNIGYFMQDFDTYREAIDHAHQIRVYTPLQYTAIFSFLSSDASVVHCHQWDLTCEENLYGL